jgi:DNA modification methylase
LDLQEEKVFDYLKDFVFEDTGNLTLVPSSYTTLVEQSNVNGIRISKFVNEYWTSKQRQSSSIHEISYRACFKAQLPRFFIQLLTLPGDIVYDPFSGRGTTVIEAGILNRRVISNDINPLSRIIAYPRLSIPEVKKINDRIDAIPIDRTLNADIDLSMFYHYKTEAEIISIKQYLEDRKMNGLEDDIDRWIKMVATNRLTGHSPGFFSVYTLPPNQAVSQESQIKINKKRNQKPDYRDTKKIIKRKTYSLMRNIKSTEIENLRKAAKTAMFLEKDARHADGIEDNSVNLTVTSPPFLDVVQYSKDNWLRCWFNGIDTLEIEKQITMSKTLDEWSTVMGQVFHELYRITKPGGWVAFEVGEVRNGKINLEEHVVPLGLSVGFKCLGVIINLQEFTKTSNIWGIKNNNFGTNTNRIVLFLK